MGNNRDSDEPPQSFCHLNQPSVYVVCSVSAFQGSAETYEITSAPPNPPAHTEKCN